MTPVAKPETPTATTVAAFLAWLQDQGYAVMKPTYTGGTTLTLRPVAAEALLAEYAEDTKETKEKQR